MALKFLQELKISDELRRDIRLCPLIERATELLSRELEQFVGTVAVTWTADFHDQDFRVIELIIADWTGSASAQFNEEQIADESHLDWRLRQLWGDLLRISSHRQQDRLRMTVDAMVDE